MQKCYERKIISSFPYPIATRFTRLRTRQCKNAGYARLDNIFGTAEVITRYLALIVIAECRAQLETHPELKDKFPLPFAQQIKRPSWGQWVGFIREGLRWLHQQQVDLVMPELHDFWFNSTLKPTTNATALESLVSMRNEKTGHNFQGLRENEYEPLCADTWEKLSTVLESLGFLFDYELRFIDRIEVSNIRRHPTVFIHEYSTAIGGIDDFEACDERLDTFMETEATLLLNPNTRRYINLEPLMVYNKTAGKAPDVFFYSGMDKPDTAKYEACKHGGDFKLNKNINSEQGRKHLERMAEELQHLIDLFTTKTEEVTA